MAEGLVLPYLDIPFQHASPKILRAMKRPANEARVLERLNAWREICPDIAIRSTFVVGFPGETEEDFHYLLDWLEEAQLDRVGAFRFEPVEGAAANALPDPVPEAVKEERYARIMELTARICAAKLAAKVGTTLDVIIDAVDLKTAGATGRRKADAPEIDGEVHLRDAGHLQPGDIVTRPHRGQRRARPVRGPSELTPILAGFEITISKLGGNAMTPTHYLRLSIIGSAALIATAALAGSGVDGGGRRFNATLTGAAEVPGPGDADGAGKAILELNPGQNKLCYKLRATNIAAATMAHVHVGAAGASGPIAVTLVAPTDGSSSGCNNLSEHCQGPAQDAAKLLRQRPQCRIPGRRDPRAIGQVMRTPLPARLSRWNLAPMGGR